MIDHKFNIIEQLINFKLQFDTKFHQKNYDQQKIGLLQIAQSSLCTCDWIE